MNSDNNLNCFCTLPDMGEDRKSKLYDECLELYERLVDVFGSDEFTRKEMGLAFNCQTGRVFALRGDRHESGSSRRFGRAHLGILVEEGALEYDEKTGRYSVQSFSPFVKTYEMAR
jgi:hypothetical protein